MTYQIRPLVEKDIDSIVDFFTFPWSTKEGTRNTWNKFFNEVSRTAYVVFKNDQFLGYGSLLRSSENPQFREKGIPEISAIWVNEEARGKGVATFLIKHLEKIASDEGYKFIGLGVGLYKDYGSAQKLYYRLGYAPNGQGITYKGREVVPGEKYAVDDDLLMWLVKALV